MGFSILTFIAGVIVTAILMSFTTISKINEYEEESYTLYAEKKELERKYEELKDVSINAEQRALIHFRKLQAIERILKQDEKTKEFATFTVNKIKEVINDRKINQ